MLQIESGLIRAAMGLLAWWIEGLWIGCPEPWKSRWFPPRDRLLVRISGHEATIERYVHGRPVPETTLIVDLRDAPGRPELRERLMLASEPDVTLLIPRPLALEKTMSLPLAAETSLRDVLHHELDRIVPFPIGELAFDFHVSNRDCAVEKLTVTAAVVRRAVLEGLLQTLARLGIRPTAATVADAGGDVLPLNLLPDTRRWRLPFKLPTIRPLPVGAAVAAVLLAFHLPLARYDALLADHAEEVDLRRSEAVAARAAIEAERTLLESEAALDRRRHAYVAPIDVLVDLTTRLPDHTWLSRLTIGAGQVQLQGETSASSAVLELVEGSSRLEKAEFHAPVTRSDATGKDQFAIIARIREAS